MAIEEKKQFNIPINVNPRTEFFKGIGGVELLRILVTGLIALVPFLLLGVPKTEDTKMIYVEVTPMPIEYNESGEDVDIEESLEIINNNYGLTEYVEEEVTIMVNKYPIGKRMLVIIVPMVLMFLLNRPMTGSVSIYRAIQHAIAFNKNQKIYFYRRIRDDGE